MREARLTESALRAPSSRRRRAPNRRVSFRVFAVGLAMLVPAVAAGRAARPLITQRMLVSASARTEAPGHRFRVRLAVAVLHRVRFPTAAGGSSASYTYPLARRGVIRACPFVPGSTHSPFAWPNNLESDDAIDINIPLGTPVLAVATGFIGSQIGLLHSPDPHMAGLRVHLDTPTEHFYYAHLSRVLVHAGQYVSAGQVLGLSGQAVGVPHLEFAQDGGNPAVTVGDAAACPYFVQYREPW